MQALAQVNQARFQAYTQLSHQFGQQRLGAYNQEIDYERIHHLFATRRYDFEPRLIKSSWNMLKDVSDEMDSEHNPLEKTARVGFGLIGAAVVFPFSIVGGLKDIFDGVDHATTNPQALCDCDSCRSLETHEFRVLTRGPSQPLNIQTMQILHSCNEVSGLRNSQEYWPPAAPDNGGLFNDYDGGYAAD